MHEARRLTTSAGYGASIGKTILYGYLDADLLQETGFELEAFGKAMCDLLWTLWGLIQHADGNKAEDFRAYSVGRFDRCKALMQRPEFARHLAAIGKTTG